MTEWIWLNGDILPLAEASVGVEDRGFQFADGVYEVIRLYNGVPFTLKEHLDRLERSAKDILIDMPIGRAELEQQIGVLLARSNLRDGMIYLQLTRGCAPRNHIFAKCDATLLFYTRALSPLPEPENVKGTKLLSVPDERWKRCWIKSIALLPNILAKNQAAAAGADEAVFIDDGTITECSVSTFYAIMDGAIVTHPIGPKVLPGITRLVVEKLAKQLAIPFIERPILVNEAQRAQELFITSSTREILWISHWDGREIARKSGPVTLRLAGAFREYVERETHRQSVLSGR